MAEKTKETTEIKYQEIKCCSECNLRDLVVNPCKQCGHDDMVHVCTSKYYGKELTYKNLIQEKPAECPVVALHITPLVARKN